MTFEFRQGPSHGDNLRTRVDGRRLEREMKLMRVYDRMDRERAIKEALDMVPNLEFWCDKCKRDFLGYGYKQRRILPVKDATPIGFWYGHCPKELHRCIRRITDKGYDPYYSKSMMVLEQAKHFGDDLLTPDDPRFALRYPKEYERYITDNGEQPITKAVLE